MNTTDINTGLTSREAEERAKSGRSNGSFDIKTKSVGQILRSNIFTLFNLINIILAALIVMVGSYRNMLFMGVVLCNTAIGIIQEIRSKRVIDKLSLISAPKAHLLRDGKKTELPVSEIVLDDIMLLSSGQQICADGLVLDGECEVDESLITGECDPIRKKKGDELLSGSFVTSGSVRAQAVRVGAESYSNRITSGAKYVKKHSSEMMKSINRIISAVSVCIVPFGIILFLKSVLMAQQSFESGVVSTVAALIGMIPEGLVLLTSVALAVSSIRLARQQTLCQDLFCVESLARVDILCLDKTGTITEGSMQAEEVIPLDNGFDCGGALNALASAFTDVNPTLAAVKEKFGSGTDMKLSASIPFSSARKFSAASFDSYGTAALGAPEFILRDIPEKVANISKEYKQRGMRVLLLAHSGQKCGDGSLPEDMKAKALVILSDKIRKSAPETLDYFRKQGVTLKVISGDDPLTVSRVAERAGLENAAEYIDMSTVSEEQIPEAAIKYTVFGRVTPWQKLELVKAMKAAGHKVAMTGDGVNDVLALKEADCSVAMQSGSDAARSVSQLVLLNSDFASMPLAVEEGRRVINNIERSAALFLVKTIFSFLLAVMFLILPFPYPFRPIQMTLISALTIGVPSFLLALEPNHNLVRGKFISNVLKKAAPGGITVAVGIGLLTAAGYIFSVAQEQLSVMAVLLTAAVAFAVLWNVCRPFKTWRAVMFGLLIAAFAGALLLFGELFYFVPLGASEWVILAVLTAAVLLMRWGLAVLFGKLFGSNKRGQNA